MSRYYLGDCLNILSTFPDRCIDLILADPPYLVNYQDRTGRSIINDQAGHWLVPAFREGFRVLQRDGFYVSFYGWNKVDTFFQAWKSTGSRVVRHLVFPKPYHTSKRFVKY